MNNQHNLLDFDSERICHQASSLINEKLLALNRDGALIGLSGGLDSAVAAYLTVRAISKEHVTLLYMPDKDSKDRHGEDARLIANELDIHLEVLELTPILETIGVYDLLPLKLVPGRKLKDLLVKVGKMVENLDQANLLVARFSPKPNSLLAKGNAYGTAKHRLRMVMLYYYANIHNLMVVGAANKTELLTGTFSQWGCDQCADVMPVIHLYRSQLEVIAKHLQIHERIRNKPADPDIIPGVDNKEELLGSFIATDQILWGLEHDVPKLELSQRFGEEITNKVLTLYEESRFMRETPYNLI